MAAKGIAGSTARTHVGRATTAIGAETLAPRAAVENERDARMAAVLNIVVVVVVWGGC